MEYFISDLHYGHANCIGFDHRPFDSVEEMNDAIIRGISSVVGPEDDLYILGDIAMKVSKAVECLNRLKEAGVKRVHLIKGNHDNVDAIKQANCKNLIEIADYKRLSLPLDGYTDRVVILCHYPMLSWDRQMHGGILLYGHIHIQPMYYFEDGHRKILWPKNLPNAYNCISQKFDFVPQTLSQLVETYGYDPHIYEFLE